MSPPPQPTLTSTTESTSTAAVLTGPSDINTGVHVIASYTHLLICQPHIWPLPSNRCVYFSLLICWWSLPFFCLCYGWLCWDCRNTVFNCQLKCTTTLNLTDVNFFLPSLQEELNGMLAHFGKRVHCFNPSLSCQEVHCKMFLWTSCDQPDEMIM